MLAPLAPDFVSVTYGAGGTTRKLTHEAVTTIKPPVRVAGRGASDLRRGHPRRDDGDRAVLCRCRDHPDRGSRGDAPKGADRFTPHDDGFANSVELIEAIAARGDMTIRCGAYPEPHPDSADGDADVTWLKRKIEAGATSAITQFFFEPETFFRFRDKCVAAASTRRSSRPAARPKLGGDQAVRRDLQHHRPGLGEEAFQLAALDGPDAQRALATDLSVDLVRKMLIAGAWTAAFLYAEPSRTDPRRLRRPGRAPQGRAGGRGLPTLRRDRRAGGASARRWWRAICDAAGGAQARCPVRRGPGRQRVLAPSDAAPRVM